MKLKEPNIDPAQIPGLLRKRVIVGLNYFNAEMKLRERRQYFGVIDSIDADGIVLRHPATGEKFTLPPDLDALKPAGRGRYRLRISGEIVEDPDFVAHFDIYQDLPAAPDDLEK